MKNKNGGEVPIRSLASLRVVQGPQVITRYNNYRAVPVQGSPKTGISSGAALTAMAAVSGQDPADRLQLRVDRDGPIRSTRPTVRRDMCSA